MTSIAFAGMRQVDAEALSLPKLDDVS